MKKLFALLLTFAAVALFAADYQFPGWKCTDQAKLTAAAAAAPSEWEKTLIVILQKLATNPVSNFEQLCKIIDEEVNASEITDKNSAFIEFKKQFPYCRNEFIKEAWEFCKKNPSAYDFYFVAYKAEQLNLTELQRYLSIRDLLFKYNTADASHVRELIDSLLDVAVASDGVDGISVKEDLQKLNRKFSKHLLDDKAAWEPVIAKIRTTLETY